jgi:NDP-sugar pyrophosphorylase family protein
MLPIVLLAGGLATRLHPLTRDLPKSLIEVGGRPFIDWQLELLEKNGYRDVVMCVNYKAEKIIERIGNGNKFGLDVTYSHDGPQQLGTAGAIKKALSKVGPKFAVLYGDSYLPIDYGKVENEFLKTNSICLMTYLKNENQFDMSNIELKNDSIVSYSKENPTAEMKYIDYGLSYYSREVFDSIAENENTDLSTILEKLAQLQSINGHEILQRFYEIGSFEGIASLTEYLEGVEIVK